MSTVELVQRSVMSSMLRGELAPGSWVRQEDLAVRLGVSKIPVREALQRLAAMGLLRFEANRGAVVPTLSAADAEEIFAMRSATEPLLLARSIPNLTVVDLAEAELAIEDDSLADAEANWRFHRALYRAAGWQRGLAMCETLHTSVAPYLKLYVDGLGGAPDSDDQHRALLEHCRSANVSAATSVLDEHLGHAAESLDTYLTAAQSTDNAKPDLD